MKDLFFVHEIKETGDNIDKGIVVKNTFESAKQSYHAYLGAYAYGQHPDTDYVQCSITDVYGHVIMTETWTQTIE